MQPIVRFSWIACCLAAAVTTALVVSGAAGAAHGAPAPGRVRPGEVLVQLKPGASAGAFGRRTGLALAQSTSPRVQRIRVRPGEERSRAATLSADPDVEAAAPSYVRTALDLTPNDPLYPKQWHLPAIAAPTAWATTTGSRSIRIAVLDSGADLTHPDLRANLGSGASVLYVDPAQTVQDRCATPTAADSPQDDYSFSHGTHVAGIVAAVGNNGAGVTGVSWQAQVLPVKVLDCTGNGSDPQIIAGIDWAIANNANIISMSLGGPGQSAVLDAAVMRAWRAGLVVVVAAGNSSTSERFYPAASPGALAVSATDQADGLASFSNYGSYIGLAAPGVAILSTLRGGTYGTKSGTSMAAPVVAGAAALVWGYRPDLDNGRLVGVLLVSADKVTGCPSLGRVCAYDGTGRNDYFGHGRLNVARALQTVGVAVPLLLRNSAVSAR